MQDADLPREFLWLICSQTAVRNWVEYGLKQSKNELGWADFRVMDYSRIAKMVGNGHECLPNGKPTVRTTK